MSDLNKPESKSSILRRLRKERRFSTVSLPSALEFRREAYGLRAYEFADLLGMTSGHYSEFVRGHRGLPIKALRRAYAIGVPHDVLLAEQP